MEIHLSLLFSTTMHFSISSNNLRYSLNYKFVPMVVAGQGQSGLVLGWIRCCKWLRPSQSSANWIPPEVWLNGLRQQPTLAQPVTINRNSQMKSAYITEVSPPTTVQTAVITTKTGMKIHKLYCLSGVAVKFK